MSFPECNHTFEETEDVLIRRELAPVQPPNFVILVVRVVVAQLRVQEFITCAKHWGPIGQEEQATEILYLLPTQR